jgi:hypothetical protein
LEVIFGKGIVGVVARSSNAGTAMVEAADLKMDT